MRVWDQGRGSKTLSCFDFLNQDGQPVNTPAGWKIFSFPSDEAMPNEQLLSIEVSMGMKEEDISPGNEKYAVPEGMRCRISIPHRKCGLRVVHAQSTTSEFSASVYASF
jgi:hypothetical protein